MTLGKGCVPVVSGVGLSTDPSLAPPEEVAPAASDNDIVPDRSTEPDDGTMDRTTSSY